MAWDFYRSHAPFDTFQPLATDGYHVAVLHGTLDAARYGELYDRDVPLRLERLGQSGMDYVALGHLHAFQQHNAGGVPVIYPGTLEGRRFTPAEEGERYLVTVTLNKGSDLGLEKLRWNSRTLQSIQLNLDDEPVENGLQLANLIRRRHGTSDRLMRIELTGTSPFIIDTDNLRNQLASDFSGSICKITLTSSIAGWPHHGRARIRFVDCTSAGCRRNLLRPTTRPGNKSWRWR